MSRLSKDQDTIDTEMSMIAFQVRYTAALNGSAHRTHTKPFIASIHSQVRTLPR